MKSNNLLSTLKIVLLFVFVGVLFSLTSCDVNEPEEEETVTDTLFVKFVNNANSVATVTYFSYQTMGKADESNTPTGDWSGNVLANKQTIVPGGSAYFTLKIPNLHWARYHLGIDDGSGNEILLHEQSGFQEANVPVTHWGGDTRTISTKIMKNDMTDLYYTSGYSDWVGID